MATQSTSSRIAAWAGRPCVRVGQDVAACFCWSADGAFCVCSLAAWGASTAHFFRAVSPLGRASGANAQVQAG
jgi:hypothetical protein